MCMNVAYKCKRKKYMYIIKIFIFLYLNILFTSIVIEVY